jgi:aromatic ring hydroxylase
MTNLSPAAQAVLDAAFVPWETIDTPQSIAAAALRAAVAQVTPVSTNARQMKIRDELLAIANELEGMSN